MGTVLGNANPVLPISEHVREVVPVDPPQHSGPLGPEGEPTKRELQDDLATDVTNNDLSFDVRDSAAGYEYPFWPHIYIDDNLSDAYFVERGFLSNVALDANGPFITITDCDGYTAHVGAL